MLNVNKIESLLNADEMSKPQIAKEWGIDKQTVYSKIDRKSFNFRDIEKIADYFDKPMLYFFDREDNHQMVREDSPPYGCHNCAEKQKEIDRLQRKLEEVNEKYIKVLEGKNTNARNCG